MTAHATPTTPSTPAEHPTPATPRPDGDGAGLVQVVLRGDLPEQLAGLIRVKVARVQRFAPRTVRGGRVVLTLDPDPAVERPARIVADLDVDGTPVRAHAEEATASEAIDAMLDRLRRRMSQLAERRADRHRWIEAATQAEAPAVRGARQPRPRPAAPGLRRAPAERAVVRRKTFALDPITPDEAAYEMDLLAHDFYLFRDKLTGRDALIHRREDGTFGLSEVGHAWTRPALDQLVVEPPPPKLSEEAAIERLDAGGEPFVFHVDPQTGRGRVVYRRYDGHYGVIVPA